MANEVLSFQEWGRTYRGLAGQTIDPKNSKQEAAAMVKLRQEYGQYVEGTRAPQVTFTNAPSGEPLAVLGNTMTKLGTEAPKVELFTGKDDGALYAVNPQTRAAMTITNAEGKPFMPAAKQSGGGINPITGLPWGAEQAQQPAPQQSGGVLSWLFGGAKEQPAPQAQAAAMPQAAPVPSPAAVATPSPAPTPAMPAFKTQDEVKAAYRAGQIDQATAVQMLRGM